MLLHIYLLLSHFNTKQFHSVGHQWPLGMGERDLLHLIQVIHGFVLHLQIAQSRHPASIQFIQISSRELGPYWMIHPLLVVNLERKWMDQEIVFLRFTN
jgi:hypothetical protein